ncbi:hypothetical protein P7K49_012408, partial [Saguinus oedipus]
MKAALRDLRGAVKEEGETDKTKGNSMETWKWLFESHTPDGLRGAFGGMGGPGHNPDETEECVAADLGCVIKALVFSAEKKRETRTGIQLADVLVVLREILRTSGADIPDTSITSCQSEEGTSRAPGVVPCAGDKWKEAVHGEGVLGTSGVLQGEDAQLSRLLSLRHNEEQLRHKERVRTPQRPLGL